MRYKEYEPKRDTFYILYNENDFPVFYADTLKEFCSYFKYTIDYIYHKFIGQKKFIYLTIDKKDYFLYKFTDKELINV